MQKIAIIFTFLTVGVIQASDSAINSEKELFEKIERERAEKYNEQKAAGQEERSKQVAQDNIPVLPFGLPVGEDASV